ncbi:DUF3194 domain-containing protein [Candidatus Bathyarchaeota archaeon]|nr:DUF3194 domain-containing protein [Candidatus Bathyarchaeota archaeon]
MEEICEIAESSARRFLLSKIPSNRLRDIDFSIDVEGEIPLNVEMELRVTLTRTHAREVLSKFSLEELVDEALNRAFKAVESYLRDRRLDYNL